MLSGLWQSFLPLFLRRCCGLTAKIFINAILSPASINTVATGILFLLIFIFLDSYILMIYHWILLAENYSSILILHRLD